MDASDAAAAADAEEPLPVLTRAVVREAEAAELPRCGDSNSEAEDFRFFGRELTRVGAGGGGRGWDERVEGRSDETITLASPPPPPPPPLALLPPLD